MKKPIFRMISLTVSLSVLAGCSMGGSIRVWDPDPTQPGENEVDPNEGTQNVDKEECNGEDDDGDGLIDEDFPDIDEDGIADCVDLHCEVEAPLALGVVMGACPPAATPDPWHFEELWKWDVGLIASAPVVGDIDGDGQPEVLFVDGPSPYAPGDLVALDGSSGVEKWRSKGVADSGSGMAIGDVDSDGDAEIFAVQGTMWMQRPVSFDHEGNLLWQGDWMYTVDAGAIVLSDVDDDGEIEVVVGLQILDAVTGDEEAQILDPGYYVEYPMPYVADIDLDGTDEILLNGHVFDHNGEIEFTCMEGEGALHGAPIQADGDLNAEIVFSGQGKTGLCDDDGTLIWSIERAGMTGWMGVPLVSDLDGDGFQEIGIPEYGAYSVYEADGTLVWTVATHDASGMSGSIAWDMDQDGVDEILYADQTLFYVFDGRTGSIRMKVPHQSSTMLENPVVADVDGDGEGEILRVQAQGSPTNSGLFVLESHKSYDKWPYAPPYFTQHGYYMENVNSDLTIPIDPPDSWSAIGVMSHGQPSATRIPEAQLANWLAVVPSACIASCDLDGFVAAYVQAGNNGDNVSPMGTLVEVWGSNGSQSVLLKTFQTTSPMYPGESESFYLETTAQFANAEIWTLVDPENVIEECDEDDNVASFVLPGCN